MNIIRLICIYAFWSFLHPPKDWFEFLAKCSLQFTLLSLVHTKNRLWLHKPNSNLNKLKHIGINLTLFNSNSVDLTMFVWGFNLIWIHYVPTKIAWNWAALSTSFDSAMHLNFEYFSILIWFLLFIRLHCVLVVRGSTHQSHTMELKFHP